MMNRILIVDDLPEALAMLAQAVRQAYPQARRVCARSLNESLSMIGRESFDLAMVDLLLPDGYGVELIAALSEAQPRCTIVVVTIHDDDENLFRALQAGAQGYLLKDRPTDWLAQQLLGISQGQPALSPAIARRLLYHFRQVPPVEQGSGVQTTLSEREREVLTLLAQGERLSEIALHLGLSRHTVGDHVKNIYRKLNIHGRAQAALHARNMGLI